MQPSGALAGELLAGRFRLKEVMGEGAMAEVYRAEHEGLGREYAIKVLRPQVQADHALVERFRREAKATSRLEHPNIVYVADFGQTEDGRLYLVMEYIKGQTLRYDIVESAPKPVSLAGALETLRQLARALQVAHDAGVVHRDLKPENILIKEGRTGEDRVKILDFGLAKIATDPDMVRLTRTGDVFGTPNYMSPEQARGGNIDGRTDLYALGIIAFELCTGRLPFIATSIPEMVRAHLLDEPPRAAEVRPDDVEPLPGRLDELIWSCLAKDPDERPAKASDMQTLLEQELDQLKAQGRGRSGSMMQIAVPDEQAVAERWGRLPAESGERLSVDDLEEVEAGPPPVPADFQPSILIPAHATREWIWDLTCKKAKELAGTIARRQLAHDELVQILRELVDNEESLVMKETDLALLQSEIEDLAAETHAAEARLRHAVVDLRVERSKAKSEGAPEALKDLDFQIEQLETSLAGIIENHDARHAEIDEKMQGEEAAISEQVKAIHSLELELLEHLRWLQPQIEDQTDLQRAYTTLSYLLGNF